MYKCGLTYHIFIKLTSSPFYIYHIPSFFIVGSFLFDVDAVILLEKLDQSENRSLIQVINFHLPPRGALRCSTGRQFSS